MFSMRRSIPARRWNKDFINTLQSDLFEAGFREIVVKLPSQRKEIQIRKGLTIEEVEEIIKEELENREITLDNFLEHERNYSAAILIARNETSNETLKILFVNISKKTSFDDPTFPSGHSVPSQLYVQSPDPGRVYSLFYFFYEYMTKKGESTSWYTILWIASLIILVTEVISFVGSAQGFVQNQWGAHIIIDVSLVILSIILLYVYFKKPTGLSINDRRTSTASAFAKRALQGEFKDNPLINLIIAVLATIFASVILKLFGWL